MKQDFIKNILYSMEQNLSKKELYFNQNLKYLNEKEKRNTLENRLTLGLNITSEEYSNIKKLKYKNDRIIF